MISVIFLLLLTWGLFVSEFCKEKAGLPRWPSRNINNLRYADDTILMAESEEEVKSLLMKVKEESEKAGLKLVLEKLRPWHLVPSLQGKEKGGKWKQ